MGTNGLGWRGVACAAMTLGCTACLTSCTSNGPATPAPVEIRGAPIGGREVAGAIPDLPARSRPMKRDGTTYVTVRPGQSLGGIAQSHHVSEREVIAVNNLKPPYKLTTGMRLRIPGEGVVSPQPAIEHAAATPPPAVMRDLAARSNDVISLDGPTPPKSAAASPPSAPAAAAAVAAEVARESERPSRAAPPSAGLKATLPPERGEVEHADPAPAAAVRGRRLPWPVQGRVLANYGTGAGGAHNDGVNIAAARGTPIRAIEGGVVAYAGNELRGYGNLVLVKHPDGLISAYAHCDELLVKKGDKIGSGQVIGRVGSSGGVSEPQLHFELRRGKQPVDPRDFLGSAPSAGRAASAG